MEHDSELVQATLRGEERAFRQLVDRHYDACLRYAYRMLGDRADAEDVVQDTFVRAYHSLRRYDEQGRFAGWLFRILVNRCRTAARKRDRQEAMAAGLETAGEPSPSREPDLSSPFQRARLQKALASLPTKIREAFLLKFVEEWTYEEMSELTGASTSALKMRISRARDALREQLKEAHDDGA